LGRLAAANEAGGPEVKDFLEWVRTGLFAAPPWRPARSRGASADLCGLSIFVPGNEREAARYRDLELLKKSRLPELWARLLAPPPAERKPEVFLRAPARLP